MRFHLFQSGKIIACMCLPIEDTGYPPAESSKQPRTLSLITQAQYLRDYGRSVVGFLKSAYRIFCLKYRRVLNNFTSFGLLAQHLFYRLPAVRSTIDETLE